MVHSEMERPSQSKPSSSSAGKGTGPTLTMNWNTIDLLRQSVQEEYWALENLTELLDDGCSVPFIARYRKERTNHMEAEKIREVIVKLDELKLVQTKASSAAKQIEKSGKMTTGLLSSLKSARTVEEVDTLFAPYKSGAKTTLAERARKLGLEPAVEVALHKPEQFQLQGFVRHSVKGLSTVAEVEKGVHHILIDIIAKDSKVVNKLRELVRRANVTIRTNVKQLTEENHHNKDTYSLYFDFSAPTRSIKPHQILAINRAEVLKVLLVKVVIPDSTLAAFKTCCRVQWVPKRSCPELVVKLFLSSIDEACTKRLLPMIVREIRSNLTKTAEKASVDVFAQNLRRLLLTPPVRGKVTMGVDPGFKHGCKVAVTSALGQILETGVVYLHGNRGRGDFQKIVEMAKKHGCETIALGNGTACRETESVLSKLITDKAFGHLNVMYCIVNEDGASIYSVSPEAEKEMPHLDPNLRSAVSIARRLQDPLVELVKIEPKHLGVGMYQHDVHDKFLKEALDGVVEECVSFVGIDLNVCTESLLRKLAGLNVVRAKKIIEYREKYGRFTNREQLLDIKGLGPKTYQQCAGFVRVRPEPTTSETQSSVCDLTTSDYEDNRTGAKRKATGRAKGGGKKRKTDLTANPLDMTWIHPESYDNANKVLSRAEACTGDIGTSVMKTKLQRLLQTTSLGELAKDLDVGEPTLKLIVDGLQQPVDYDIRAEYDQPLFKSHLQSLSDLVCGQVLTGRVTNVTHFGAFVDIGVGRQGLLHNSKLRRDFLRRGQALGPGDKVEVRVLSVQRQSDESKTRISLELSRPVQ